MLRAAILAFLLSSCRPPAPPPPTAAIEPPPPPPAASIPGLDPVDTTIDPCVDFYHHACGRWLGEHPRPPEASIWSRSFSSAEARVQARLVALLDELSVDRDGPDASLATYWRSCVDADARTAAGLTATRPLLTAIAEARPRNLAPVLALLHAHGVHALFRIRPASADDTPTLRIAGTGLGPVSMYAPPTARTAAYREHVATMLRLAGLDAPERRAGAIVAFEASLAALQATDAELRRPPVASPVLTLRGQAPTIDWDRYFTARGQTIPASLDLPARGLPQLTILLRRTNIHVLRDYLRWQLLHSTASVLPPAFAAAHERMFAASVSGSTTGCVALVESTFGASLARAYNDRHVTPDDRKRLHTLALRLHTALRAEIDRATWIDPAARATVLAHINAMTIAIAEPGPLDAPPAPITADFLATSLALRSAGPDAGRRGPARTAVNAAMHGRAVELFAGLIQPPFYAPDMPEPVVLGAIGQILAHEFGHILDPGTLADVIAWRPGPDTTAAYAARRQCIKDSYARPELAPGVRVDGDAVTTEMFADNLGLRLAHALVRADGPAAERQFFVAWGQLMCTHFTPDMLALMAQTDTAPAPLRVNQQLALYPAFAAAFACAEDTPMHPRDTCAPW